MRLAAKVFAVLFTILFAWLGFVIWFCVLMEGPGDDFWSDSLVLFTISCLVMAVALWAWLLLTGKK